jgi:hypothetical protein
MKIAEVLRAYLRSPLAIVSAGAALVLGAMSLFFLGGNLLLGLFGGAALWVAFSAVAVQTRLGAASVVAVRDADEGRRTSEAIEAAKRARETMARLRLPDPEVASKLEYVAQVSGEYLEAALKAGSHSPQADARIADSLDIVNLYMKELDEASTEKRYGLADADPFAAAKERVLAALLDNAKIIRNERIALDGGLPPESLMRVKEELK